MKIIHQKNLSIVFILLSLIIHLPPIVRADNTSGLQPFTTDGCSLFPDGDFIDAVRWRDCCVAHDYSYWQGGSAEEKIMADHALEECVANSSSEILGKVMETGVRLGGSAYFPTWFRWGYGWPYSRGYKALTLQEKKEVKEMSKQYREKN